MVVPVLSLSRSPWGVVCADALIANTNAESAAIRPKRFVAEVFILVLVVEVIYGSELSFVRPFALQIRYRIAW